MAYTFHHVNNLIALIDERAATMCAVKRFHQCASLRLLVSYRCSCGIRDVISGTFNIASLSFVLLSPSRDNV